MDISKIAKTLVKSVATGENVTIETFWQKSPCVITFLRRFGWPFCRLGARQLSALKPRLDDNNVRLIGVGLEELGVEEFVKLEFFKGELYIDTKKESYKALGFKRMNIFNLFPSIFGKKARAVYEQTKKENIPGNMAGDGMQNGGTLVIDKGGKVLLCFKQDNAADHVENSDILKALGLDAGSTGGKSEGASASGATGGAEGDGAKKKIVCEEDVCKIEK